jgi:hypothetical protein
MVDGISTWEGLLPDYDGAYVRMSRLMSSRKAQNEGGKCIGTERSNLHGQSKHWVIATRYRVIHTNARGSRQENV